MTAATTSVSWWKRWCGRRGSLRTQLMVWNIVALAVLLGILGTVIRQTVRSFLMHAVSRELERQAQQARLPPPLRRERPPRPDDPEGPPMFKHLGGRASRNADGVVNGAGASYWRHSHQTRVLYALHYDDIQGPPLHPPERFPGPPPFGGRHRLPPPPRDTSPYRPHHFDLQGQSIVSEDDRPLWDPAGFVQATHGRKHFSTIDFNGESLYVLSAPVQERGTLVAIVQVAHPLADVQLAMAGLDRALLTLIPFGVLFAGFGGAYLTNRVLRRVQLTTAAARAIKVGDFSTRLPVSGKDEFSELADTFNGLLNRLQTAYQQQRQLLDQQRRFTADASHELKTPLTVIKGTTSLLLQGQPTIARYHAALDDIDRAADTMAHLVQDLLLLARSDAGQLGKDPIELLVRDVLDSARAGVAERGTAIDVHMTDETLSVMGNESELVRLFTNLLNNALRYTPSDGAITVTAYAVGPHILITVRDVGPGIAPEHLPYLGERFYRVDPARARTDGGTGLGLSICKGIVAAHHGTLRIESTLGVGTTVRVELPRSQ